MLASRPRPHPQKQVEKKTVGNIFVKQISEKNINDENLKLKDELTTLKILLKKDS
jgi:hypothetical protein